MKINQQNKMLNMLIVGCFIAIVILVCFNLYLVKVNTVSMDYSNMTEDEVVTAIDNKIDNIEIRELSEKNERERMEYYASKFLKATESNQYESAYNMLYQGFKDNFFKTQEEFENYARRTFPIMMNMDFTNIERNGDIYVLWVNIGNAMGDPKDTREINIVIRENSLNDFDLSFSVI